MVRLAIFILLASVLQAQLLTDGGFETDEGWQQHRGFQAEVHTLKGDAAHDGARAIRLKAGLARCPASISQELPALAAGVYELTVWAHGSGRLRLAIVNLQTRTFELNGAPDWQLYGLTLEVTDPGPATVAIVVPGGDVVVDDAALTPADAELQARWKRQQEALTQFYFIPQGYSAQRPAPNAAGAAEEQHTPEPRTDRSVYYDPCYDTSWNEAPDRIAAWYTRRGFTTRNAEETAAWMAAKIADGAFASVVLMAMGNAPTILVDPGANGERCLMRRYLDAGGRVVWTGDTSLYVQQGAAGPVHSDGSAIERILGMGLGTDRWRPGEGERTAAGQAWGLEGGGSTIRAVAWEQCTLVLGGNREERAASVWLKTTNPAYPLSGFIAAVGALAPTNVTALRDFYRLAVFVGEPVTIPEPPAAPPAPPAATLTTEAAGAIRSALLRGEVATVRIAAAGVPAPEVRTTVQLFADAPRLRVYEMAAAGVPQAQADLATWTKRREAQPVLWSATVTGPPAGMTVELPTADLAVGDYEIHAVVTGAGLTTPLTAAATLAICPPVARHGIGYVMRGGIPVNRFRRFAYLDLLREAGMGVQVGMGQDLAAYDALLRNGQDALAAPSTPSLLTELRKGAHGEDFPDPWGGGRPGLTGVAGEGAKENALTVNRQQAERLAPYPAFSRIWIVNDDFSARGGWDYGDANVRAFKAKTGLDAPRPAEFDQDKLCIRVGKIATDLHVIPDDEPWLLWNWFLCHDVLGGFNTAQCRGFDAGAPGSHVWPVPGGAQVPLFNIVSGQYPPANFGPDFGLDIAGYYAYLSYWAPTLTYTYWTEVARMGNRDIPLWVMPNAADDERHYLRNMTHLVLASGTDGIAYFAYSWTGPDGMQEFADLGATLGAYGPLLAALRPARRRAGLLLPFAQAVYEPGWPVGMGNIFNSLAVAHIDLTPIAEEELADPPCDVILLSRVDRLRASSVAALERFAGPVFVDDQCTVDVPGATKLDGPLGTGGIWAYGDPEKTAELRARVADADIQPYDSPETTTFVRGLDGPDGTRFLYAVQLDTQEEYTFYRKNIYEPRTFRKTPPASDEEIAAFMKTHGMLTNVADTEMTVVFPARELPVGGAVVDVYGDGVLPTRPAGEGRLAVTVTARRFGGALLALLPALPGEPTVTGGDGGIVVSVPNVDVCPVRVELRRPDGSAAPEVTGNYATRGGKLALPFTVARNHPPGAWTVAVTERFTGKQARTTFTVK